MLSDDERITSVINIHDVPRFGGSSDMSLLASYEKAERYDYIYGVVRFASFLLFLFLAWSLILIVLKYLGSKRVGCAAGGEPIYTRAMYRDGKHRTEVQAIIKRADRVQMAFIFFGLTILSMSGLFLSYGLTNVIWAASDIRDTNEDIRDLVLGASAITSNLAKVTKSLEHSGIREVLGSNIYCPSAAENPLILDKDLKDSVEAISKSLKYFDDNVAGNVDEGSAGLEYILNATRKLDESIDWVEKQDWQPRMYVLVLDVLTIFLIGGAFLSMGRVAHEPFHCLFSYMLVPAFIGVMLLSCISMSGFAIATVMNADFCSGGDEPGSPDGTVEAILIRRDVSDNDLLYQSFMYYMAECTTENPLAFMQPYENELFSAISSANTFVNHANARGVDVLSEACGTDMAPVIQAVQVLSDNLNLMLKTLQETITITGCAKISPVMRKIFYGETCNDCVNGLTWMFSSLFAICCSGMIMISLRAALYNARVQAKDQERSEGNIDDITVKTGRTNGKSSRRGIRGHHEITQVQSFETGLTTQTSSQDSEDTLSPSSKDEEMKPLTPPPRLGGMDPIPEAQTPMESSVADSIRDVDSMGSRDDEFMDEESIGSNYSKKRTASSKGMVKSFLGRFGGGGIEMTPTQRIGMAPMSQIQTPLRKYDDSGYYFSSPDSFASDESAAADMTMSSPSIFRTPQAPSKRVLTVRRLQNSYKK